jgi:hypothetical protein
MRASKYHQFKCVEDVDASARKLDMNGEASCDAIKKRKGQKRANTLSTINIFERQRFSSVD